MTGESLARWKGDRLLQLSYDDGRAPWIDVAEFAREPAPPNFETELDALLPRNLARPLSSVTLGSRVAAWSGMDAEVATTFARGLASISASGCPNAGDIPSFLRSNGKGMQSQTSSRFSAPVSGSLCRGIPAASEGSPQWSTAASLPWLRDERPLPEGGGEIVTVVAVGLGMRGAKPFARVRVASPAVAAAAPWGPLCPSKNPL